MQHHHILGPCVWVQNFANNQHRELVVYLRRVQPTVLVRHHQFQRSSGLSGSASNGALNPPYKDPQHPPKPAHPERIPVGQLLFEMGALSQADLVRATALRQRQDTRIGDILLAHGMVEERTLYEALARQYRAEVADFKQHRVDVRLIDALGADECLRRGILPWRRVGTAVLIASCRPEQFEDIRPFLTSIYGQVHR